MLTSTTEYDQRNISSVEETKLTCVKILCCPSDNSRNGCFIQPPITYQDWQEVFRSNYMCANLIVVPRIEATSRLWIYFEARVIEKIQIKEVKQLISSVKMTTPATKDMSVTKEHI